ncbi:MAG TPA: GNAT family N-acetyltransferase [Thermoplasmata archaeon]|nr:GNAT family N-acetyltransferase [Thermoplasmata archaeon]
MRCIAETTARPTLAPGPADRPAVVLRAFRPSDVPYIAAIVEEGLHERYDPSLYGSLSVEWPEGFLVAADPNDVPVGFLLGVSQVVREGRILMFAVERDHRAQGVGALLMDEFLVRCRARGFRRATLEVRVSNATAIRFYARYQYSVVDLLRGYYSDGENGYQMARPL